MKILRVFVEVSLFGILAFLGSPNCMAVAKDSVTNNPFADIAERNVFGLRKPPEVQPQEAPKLPVTIKLTGFEQHGVEQTRVLMAEVPKDPKEPWKYFNLGVGEKEGGVEVVRILPGQVAVDVVINGEPAELTVKSNSFLTGPAATGAVPAGRSDAVGNVKTQPGMNGNGTWP
jgi:hypothetical protein